MAVKHSDSMSTMMRGIFGEVRYGEWWNERRRHVALPRCKDGAMKKRKNRKEIACSHARENVIIMTEIRKAKKIGSEMADMMYREWNNILPIYRMVRNMG